jgi:hypothetical protein
MKNMQETNKCNLSKQIMFTELKTLEVRVRNMLTVIQSTSSIRSINTILSTWIDSKQATNTVNNS